jgi:hypothetical protein
LGQKTRDLVRSAQLNLEVAIFKHATINVLIICPPPLAKVVVPQGSYTGGAV